MSITERLTRRLEELGEQKLTRKEFLAITGRVGIVGAGIAAASMLPEQLRSAEAAEGLPFEKGKYQTFPRSVVISDYSRGPNSRRIQRESQVLQNIDIGTLGPDVDTIVAVDFQGDIPTGALEIYRPPAGQRIEETRVVFIKRTDLETVQLRKALSGDRFDVQQISEYGGDEALDEMARLHAQNTARKHQKVIYLGDLGAFEKQWGQGEKPLLTRMISAQRPARLDLGIPEPDFVNPRQF